MSQTFEQPESNDEEMTVTLDLEDGSSVECAIVTILTVNNQDYIVLLPLDENGENEDGEVWFYRYSENENDPNEEPVLDYIDDDDEYEAVADAFDEFLDTQEFDEITEQYFICLLPQCDPGGTPCFIGNSAGIPIKQETVSPYGCAPWFHIRTIFHRLLLRQRTGAFVLPQSALHQ